MVTRNIFIKGLDGKDGNNGLDGYPILKNPALKINPDLCVVSPESVNSSIAGDLVMWNAPVFLFTNGIVEQAGNEYPDNTLGTAKYINSTYSAPQYSIEFFLNATEFEIYFKGNYGTFRVFVDDFFVCENLTQKKDGNLYYQNIKINGAKSVKKIRIESALQFCFGGIKIKANDSIESPSLNRQKKALFFTDSFGEPSGITGGWNSFCHVTGRILGLNSIASGSGGTGYTTGGGVVGRLKFNDRINDITKFNPDIVFVCGGVNDFNSTNEFFQECIDIFYTNLKQLLPNAQIVIVSNWRFKGSLVPKWDDISYRLERKANEIGALFIDTRNWITGDGNIANPNDSGNADIFIQEDGVHPTEQGQIFLGEMLAKSYVSKRLSI